MIDRLQLLEGRCHRYLLQYRGGGYSIRVWWTQGGTSISLSGSDLDELLHSTLLNDPENTQPLGVPMDGPKS